MFNAWLPRLLSLTLLSLSVPSAVAAPPKLDYFFPAGAQRGSTTNITAAGTFARWPPKVHVEGKGVDVKPAKASGKLTVSIAKDAEPGVYWIRLYDDEGATGARPFIVGLLPEIMEREPNDDPKKPQVIAQPSVVVNGRLGKPDDVDTFAVSVKKGQTLVASLEAHRTLRSPMDGVMQILSADGFVLEQNDDYHDLDPQIAFTAPKDGTYLVRIFAFPSIPDATVRFAGKETYVYRLTLATGPYVEYTFPHVIPTGVETQVDLVGWNLPDDLQRLTLKARPDTNLFQMTDPRIVNAFPVRQAPGSVVARRTPLAIKPATTVTGRFEKRGERHVYALYARAAEKLSIRVDSRSLGFLVDPVLIVRDTKEKELAQTKAASIGSDASLEFKAPADGVYSIEVRDLVNEGSLRHVYRLRVAPVTPDFDLKVATDMFTLSAAKPLDIPVTTTRVGGFKQDIALRVEGAPEEIKVTATAKGVTLRVPQNVPFAGPIRIVGVAGDGSTRVARAAVGNFAHTTESLWLSVTHK